MEHESVAISLDKDNRNPNEAKFTLDIEGILKPWDQPTITTEEIATLGGWDFAQGVIMVDKDNNEQTLKPGEVIELKPGMGFSKKVRFRRGCYARTD